MSRERTSDVVLLVVETGDAGEELALRQAVRDVLGLDDAGQPWYVERLFLAIDPETSPLDRFFRVSGSVDAPPQRFEQAAFEIAYRFSDATGFHARPDLPSSAFAPVGEDTVEAQGSAQEHHLPGSGAHDWALDAIRCREAWKLPPNQGGATHGEGIVIAHPDTGYTDHRDAGVAAFDLRRDRDLLANDDDAVDPLDTWSARPLVHPGHGTSTASVLAARKVTSIEGAAPKATVVPLRTVKTVVQVLDTDVARAVRYAHQIRAHVVSMSLGGVGFVGLREAIDLAVADGLIVLAAGNYAPFVVAPASYPNCIAVAATNAEDKPWSGSSRGEKVFISAPGESVWVATYAFDPSTGAARPRLERHHGTSFAVAHTAAAAALWLAHHGRGALITRYGKSRLQAVFFHMVAAHGHRRPDGWDTRNFGVGILDARALLDAPLPDPSALDERVEAAALAPPSAGEHIALLFPDLTPAEIERGLAMLIGVEGPNLSAKVERYEAELVRIFSERPEAWEALMSAAKDVPVPRSAEPSPGTVPAALDPAISVARFGSPTLNRELVSGPGV